MKLPENNWLYGLKAEIQKIEPTAQLILYGSRARGDARPDSDWDLLLLTEKPRLSFEERRRFAYACYFDGIRIGGGFESANFQCRRMAS